MSHIFTRLKQQKLLVMDKKAITILDIPALTHSANAT